MPIQEPKGLPGLRGWSSLSAEERAAFRAAHPDINGLPMRQQISAYRNQQFIDRFGMDAFRQMNRQERDAAYRSAVIGDAIDDSFKDDENYAEIKGMTPDSQYELLNSDYKTNTDRLKELNEFDEKHGNAFRAGTLLVGQAGLNLAKGNARNKAASIFNEIQAKDSQRKADNVKGYAQELAGTILSQLNSGELNVNDFDTAFNNVMKGSTTTVQTGVGEYQNVNPGVRYYKAFENSHELQDYTLEDKIKDYAEYVALQRQYGTSAAITRMENKFQQRIADNQNVGDWVGSAFFGAGTKAAANIANKVVGLSALSMAGDKERLANYLEGKDKYGNDLPWWQSPKYWNGVDQFSSLDPAYIARVQNEYGGVSKYNLQSAPGEERSFGVAVNEALKMAGYMASDAIVAGGFGKVANALVKGVGGASTALGKAIDKTAPFAIGALNATGISEAYGIGTYDQTLQEANQRIDDRIQQEAQRYVQRTLGKESRLKLENGRLVGNSDSSRATAELINNYVVSKTNEILQSNPQLSIRDINQEALYEEGLNKYAEVLRTQYMDDHKEDYEYDRKLARDAAATAYMIDASLEELRMALANVTYRKFLLGDAQRKALMNNFEDLVTVEKGNNLVVRSAAGASEKYSKWQPILRNIWGGARDNYLDDVTVAFSKGFAISQFNDAMDSEVSPEQYAATIDGVSRFLSGFAGGLSAARESFTDPQSLFDGFVGGLGSAITIAPRFGRMFGGDAGNAYDQADIAIQAYENRDPETGIIDIEGYKNSEQFKKDVANGKIRRRSVAEIVNDYIFNPLLQDYSDASQRLRDYQYIVDTANKVINEYRETGKFDEIVRFASAFNGATVAEEGRSLADTKDKKAKEAFAIIRQLQNWTQHDPVFSQSSYLQQVQQQLESFAKGNIDADTIAQFINRPENKEVKESKNAESIARERIQSNAKQLLNMQQSYTDAMENIRSSSQFRVIENTVGAESVANQLAFYKAMYDNRTSRLSEMEREISGAGRPSEISSPIALYGSEQGRQRYEDYQNELITAQEKQITKLEEQLQAVKEMKLDPEQRRIAVKSKEMQLAEAKRRLKDFKTELNTIKEAKGTDFSTVLSKQEILSLNPVERARVLQSRLNIQEDESPAQYSEAQRRVVDELVRELNLKDPTLLEKIKDSKTLYERNQDLAKANEIMQNDMRAAADYYNWAQGQRMFGAARVFDRRVRDYNDDLLNSIDDADTDKLIAQAKQFSSSMLNDYIKRHSEKEDILKPIAELANLKEDTHSALNSLFEGDTERIANYARRIDNIYNSDVITNSEQAMSAFEDLIDGSEGEASSDFEKVLDKLQQLHWLRNATKVEERKARREQEAQQEAQRQKEKDGSSYGWDGYKVGDTVYHTKKRTNFTGYVQAFDPVTNAMHVRWGSNKGIDVITNKSLVTKDPAVRNSSQENVDNGNDTYMPEEKNLVEGKGRTLFTAPKTLDNDGSVVELTPQEIVQRAQNSQNVEVIKPTIEEPVKIANKTASLEGVLVGNALYEYESSGLADTAKGQRVAIRKPARGSLEAFYAWEDATKTNVQAIIDDELSYILDENPDIEVRFMTKNVPSGDKMGDVMLQVIEFTPQVEKYHLKDSDGSYLNGGVFDSGGKKWLVIGTMGYNPAVAEMQDAWRNIINTIKGERKPYFDSNTNENYYVSPTFSTKIDKGSLYAGWIVDSFGGQDAGTLRTLGSLLEDSKSNPHGLNYDNMAFGIMYTRDGFVTINSNNLTEGKQVFGPRDEERNVGLAFILVPASNGNYIPAALDPVNLNQINKDSDLARIIDNRLNQLTSQELADREEALKELSRYLVFVKGQDEIRVKGDYVTVVRNGVEKRFSINDPAFGVSLKKEITDVASFRISVTPDVLSDSGYLELYDRAGALVTTAAKLGTVNASYNVLMMDIKGRAIEKPSVPSGEVAVVQSKPKGNTVTYLGEDFTLTDNNQVYDINGQKVPDSLAIQVRLSNYLSTQNLQPEHIAQNNTAKYYRIQTSSKEVVAIQYADGRVKMLEGRELGTYNSRIARKRADDAAREAIKNNQPLPDQADNGRTLNLPKTDLGTSMEGIQTQQTQPAEQKPVEQPAQSESRQSETISDDRLNDILTRKARFDGDLREAANALPDKWHELLTQAVRATNPSMKDGFIKELITLSKKYSGNPAADAILESTNQQQKPAETPRKKIDNGIITKPVVPSENQEKTYNFGKELRNSNSRTHIEIKGFLTRKGKFNEDMSLNDIKKALKEFNISYDTVTNEESLIEMLNNCR